MEAELRGCINLTNREARLVLFGLEDFIKKCPPNKERYDTLIKLVEYIQYIACDEYVDITSLFNA